MKFTKKQDKPTVVQVVEQVTVQVSETPKEINLSRGDVITVKDQVCKVVEVVDTNRWHVKNTQEPFNSFIITDADLEV